MQMDPNDILREEGEDALRTSLDKAAAGGSYKARANGGGLRNGGNADASIEWLADPLQLSPVLDPKDPIGCARELVSTQLTKGGIRCVHHHRGGFYRWDAACYRPEDDASVRARVWTFLEGARCEPQKGKQVPFRPTRSRVTDVLDALSAVCNLPAHVAPPTWLPGASGHPPPREILPVANGLLHLPSGKLLSATPAFFGLNAAAINYDPQAPAPKRWLTFLSEVFGDDVEAIETLQEFVGYTLVPETAQQKILLQVGPLRSGKGTIARILTELVGKENVAAPTLASLSSNFGLAPLIGKPLAIISDARLGSRSDQAAIAERLLSISGEDAITIDRKFQAAWTGRLPTRFIVLSNELPRLADASGALAKRFVVITHRRSFYGHEDHGLFEKLLPELPGILNWARDGYLRLRERGYFIQPTSSREAIEDLETLGSPITAFVRERCVLAAGHSVSCQHVYEEWQTWCTQNGRREPGTLQTFGRDLRAAFPTIERTQPRSELGRYRLYEGLGLQT